MRLSLLHTAPLLLALVAAPAAAQVGGYPSAGTSDADRLAAAIRRVGASPRDISALIEAGELSVKVGDATAAAALFKRAEQIDPNNGRVKAGIARILVNGEHPGEALRYFALAERNGLSMTPYAADRGLAYDLIGQQGYAQRDYRVALKQADDDEVRRRYALSLGISGRQKEALEEIDALLRRSDRGAWRARAFILAMNGDIAGANKIATSMMPGLAANLGIFFQRLPTLGAADRAFAVHFGEVNATPARVADARLAPALTPLPVETAAARPVQVAAATLTPQPQPAARDRRRGRRAPDRREVAAAPVVTGRPVAGGGIVPATTPQPSPAASVPTPVPSSAAPSSVAAGPAAVSVPSPSPSAVVVATPAPVAGAPVSAAVAPAATVAGTPIGTAPATAAAPPLATIQPLPTPAPAVASTSPLSTVAPRPSPSPAAVAATPIPGVVPAVKAAPPRAIVASAPPRAAVRATTRPANPASPPAILTDNDSVLARIVAAIVVPSSELKAGDAKPATATGSLDRAARRAERNAVAQRGTTKAADPDEPAAKPPTAAERRAKAAADRKAKAEVAEKKALADKAAAEKKAAKADPARYWVQVAGGASERDLGRAWSAVQKKSPALAGKKAYSTPLRATNRVVTGPFKTEAEARAMVNTLAKQGVSAFTFASSAGQKMTRLDGE